MSRFQFAARTAEISDPGKMLVEIDDRMIALFHVNGQFYALDDVCTHDGGPLADGELCGYEIACPRHGARFDIRSGRALSMPATKATAAHEVRVEGNEVQIRLNDGTPLEDSPGAAGRASPAATSPASAAAPIATPGDAATDDAEASVLDRSIRESLKQVVDPELFVNIVDLGLVYGVDLAPSAALEHIGRHDVKIRMTLTSPACPAGPQLIGQTKEVLSRMPTVGAVEVQLVMDPLWTPDRMTEAAKDQLGIF